MQATVARDNSPGKQIRVLTWPELMEGLVVGALRGMAETHATLERATGGALQPLSDLTMFQASEVMAAMLLKASAACEEARTFPSASRTMGRDALAHRKAFRAEREKNGAPTLYKNWIRPASIDRERTSSNSEIDCLALSEQRPSLSTKSTRREKSHER